MAGRGKADQHRTSEVNGQIPVIHTDYGFLGEKRDVEQVENSTIPFVIVKDGPPPAGTRWVDSHAVQSKGIQHEYSYKIVAQDFIHAGHGKFIFKSDGEYSLVAVKKATVSEVRRTGRDVTVTPEESPV